MVRLLVTTRLGPRWTWLGGAYHRSGANREAKYLQLRHAFETLAANRVEFKTDALNERANPALLGIGATFEGTFRDHMIMPEGRLRSSNYYSVIAPEWRYGDVRAFPKLRAILEVGGRFPDADTLDYAACFERGIRVLSCAPSFAP